LLQRLKNATVKYLWNNGVSESYFSVISLSRRETRMFIGADIGGTTGNLAAYGSLSDGAMLQR
jgi:hypothetical protein